MDTVCCDRYSVLNEKRILKMLDTPFATWLSSMHFFVLKGFRSIDCKKLQSDVDDYDYDYDCTMASNPNLRRLPTVEAGGNPQLEAVEITCIPGIVLVSGFKLQTILNNFIPIELGMSHSKVGTAGYTPK